MRCEVSRRHRSADTTSLIFPPELRWGTEARLIMGASAGIDKPAYRAVLSVTRRPQVAPKPLLPKPGSARGLALVGAGEGPAAGLSAVGTPLAQRANKCGTPVAESGFPKGPTSAHRYRTVSRNAIECALGGVRFSGSANSARCPLEDPRHSGPIGNGSRSRGNSARVCEQ